MSLKNQYQNPTEEEKFEKELLQSLRYYGYLFPESLEDVERFEMLYGDTEIEVPEHLDSLEKIKPNDEFQPGFNFSNNIAAFSANNQHDFDLFDELGDEGKKEE